MGTKRSRQSVHRTEMLKAASSMEFRASSTDAWYDVRLVVDGKAEVMHVLYNDFPEELDEVYSADGFRTERELEEFKCRFRPLSLQLQDRDCRDLAVGSAVCASMDLGDEGLRFYDAVVESIESSKGQSKGCKSVCTCAFTVIWQHGPLIGKLSTKNIQDISIWQPRSQQDEALNYFLEITRKKIDARSLSMEIDLGLQNFGATASIVKVLSSSDDAATVNSEAIVNASSDDAAKANSEDPSLDVLRRKKLKQICLPSSSMIRNHRATERMNTHNITSGEISERGTPVEEAWLSFEDPSMPTTSRKKTAIGSTKINCGDPVTGHSLDTARKINHGKNIVLNTKNISMGRTLLKEPKALSHQHTKMVSKRDYYTIKIDNVEQDISATGIMNFLHVQTSVWSQVEISSSFLPNRCCAKVFVKSVERAEKLLDFLLNPAYIVISSGGNPWLIKEDWLQKSEGPGSGCEKCAKVQQDNGKLKLVCNNSRGYHRAQKLRTLCYDFIESLQNLHQKFEADEKNILRWSG